MRDLNDYTDALAGIGEDRERIIAEEGARLCTCGHARGNHYWDGPCCAEDDVPCGCDSYEPHTATETKR